MLVRCIWIQPITDPKTKLFFVFSILLGLFTLSFTIWIFSDNKLLLQPVFLEFVIGVAALGILQLVELTWSVHNRSADVSAT